MAATAAATIVAAGIMAAGAAMAGDYYRYGPDYSRQTNTKYGYRFVRPANPHAYLEEALASVAEMGGPEPGALTAQAQWYTGTLSLALQGGYTGQADRVDPQQLNGGFIKGEVRYFLGANLMLSGSLGYTGVREEAASIHGLRWGASVETMTYALPVPVSFYLAYQGNHGEWSMNDKQHNDNAIWAGFRLRLDQSSLFDTDRKNVGASLSGLSPIGGGLR